MKKKHKTIGPDKHEQHPAHSPYIAKPPSKENSAVPETSYSESEAVKDIIAGTNLEFGTEKKVEVIGNQARDCSSTINHSLGNGKLINKIEDIGGRCPFCEAEVQKAHKKGKITREEANAKAYYDVSSASQCEKCGTYTCSRHTRPVKMPDGFPMQLCKGCQKKRKWKQFVKNAANFLITPFLEDKK